MSRFYPPHEGTITSVRQCLPYALHHPLYPSPISAMRSLNSFGSGGKTVWHSYGAFALASNLSDVCSITRNHYAVEALTSTLRSTSSVVKRKKRFFASAAQ